jgi:hypothetical protein
MAHISFAIHIVIVRVGAVAYLLHLMALGALPLEVVFLLSLPTGNIRAPLLCGRFFIRALNPWNKGQLLLRRRLRKLSCAC